MERTSPDQQTVRTKRIRRSRRCLRNELRLLLKDSKVADNIFVRAFKVEGPQGSRISVLIWEGDRTLRYVCRTWKEISEHFVREVIHPRKMQGEEADMVVDTTLLVAELAAAGMLGRVEGYKNFELKAGSAGHKDPTVVDSCEEMAQDLGITAEVEGWEWAWEKTGNQVLNKLRKFTQEPMQPTETDALDFLVLLADSIYGEPHHKGKPVRERPLDVTQFGLLKIRDSSAGLDLPGNPQGGNKRENALFAVKEFLQPMLDGSTHPPFVYEVQKKGNETLPVGKDQRKIFAASASQVVAEQIAFSGQIYRPRNIFNGKAQNLSLGGNTGLQMVMKLTPDLPWERAGEDGVGPLLERAKEILEGGDSLSEEDKKAWEYRIDPVLKAIFVAKLIYLTNWDGKTTYFLPLIPALASFICPLVALASNLVIIAPSFMPSGDIFTLFFNTDGQQLQLLSFKHHKQLASTIPDKRISDWYTSGIIQGDDLIIRNFFGSEYSTFCDQRWGTRTEVVTGNCHQTQFLRRGLCWLRGVPRFGYNVERAKIKMCMPRKDPKHQVEAIKSIVLSTGNAELAVRVAPYARALDSSQRIKVSSSGGFTHAAMLDPGVLESFWTPNDRVVRETGTMRKLAHKFAMHPDYLDVLYKDALNRKKTTV